jgi:hypothetical protein
VQAARGGPLGLRRTSRRMKSKIVVTSAAVVLSASGIALLFAPAEIVPAAPLIAQLLACSLLGLAAADWAGRSSAVGGIYGRPLVFGNLVTFGTGSLVVFREYLIVRGVSVLIVTVVALILAASFARLMLRGGTPR